MDLFRLLDGIWDLLEELLAMVVCALTIVYIMFTMTIIANTGTALASSNTEQRLKPIKIPENVSVVQRRSNNTGNDVIISETLVGLGAHALGMKPLIEQEIAPTETEFEHMTSTAVLAETESEQTQLVQPSAESELETEPMTESESELKANDYPYDEGQAVALAQLMYAEARGCSKREQSMVAWTVLNRVDINFDGQNGFWEVITAPDQFAYNVNGPFEQYEYEMATEILQYWAAEKDGIENTIRTLPHEYLYYHANAENTHNMFGITESQSDLWFCLPDPYES